MTTENAIKKEKKRLWSVLDSAEVPQQKKEVLEAVIENLAWQRVKLKETMIEIKNSGVVIPYDNGGNQKGIRENPIFKGYINLWKAYMIGLDKFSSYLPKEMQEEITNDATDILSQVKAMKNKGA